MREGSYEAISSSIHSYREAGRLICQMISFDICDLKRKAEREERKLRERRHLRNEEVISIYRNHLSLSLLSHRSRREMKREEREAEVILFRRLYYLFLKK